MPPSRLAGAFAIWLCAAPALADPAGGIAAPAGELDLARQQCIGLAQEVQRQEVAVAEIAHDVDLRRRDADARQRDLDGSRAEQEQLLGMLEHLSRHPQWHPANVPERAIDRRRGELLLKAAEPLLRDEAKALADEIARVAALKTEIAGKQQELAAARGALGDVRARLAAAVAHRQELTRRVMPDESASAALAAKLGHDAVDLDDLVRRADAAAERRDRELAARAKKGLPKAWAAALTADAADPSRPSEIHAFDPPQSILVVPVAGTISAAFGTSDVDDKKSRGLTIAAAEASEVVAPFDGRVVYAGPFAAFGVVLIIRHGDGYHSVLAGLSRADVNAGDWVLAGEPAGALGAGSLYFELRRDGRPVDPQPWLAKREAGRGSEIGDQKVRE